MKIEINYIKDFNDPDKARIVFKVNQPTNLGSYIVAESTQAGEHSVYSEVKNVFWLPDQELHPEDLVVLYTKKGENTSTLNKDGSTTYFYYWGLEQTLSSENKSCVVLFETSWMFKPIPVLSTKTEEINE